MSVDAINKVVLKQMVSLLGNGTTYTNDLDQVGKRLFKKRFLEIWHQLMKWIMKNIQVV